MQRFRAFPAIALALIVGAVVAFSFTNYRNGFQRGADSVATAQHAAVDSSIVHQRDSIVASLDSMRAELHDSIQSVNAVASALSARVDRLRRTSVPTVAVTAPAADSTMAVTMANDSTAYRVHVNIGRWIAVADRTLQVQDSVIRDQQAFITVRVPALQTQWAATLAQSERARAASDSLASFRGTEVATLRRRVDDLTPSGLDRTVKVATYALAIYGAIRVGESILTQ